VRAQLILMSLLAVSGCTSYTPLQLGQATPGYDVRVTLSDQGSVDLVPRIGARARQLEGAIRQASDSILVLSVRHVTREGGGSDTYDSLDVTIPKQDIDVVERNQTSVSRSVLAAGAIVATALLAAKGAGDLSGGKGNGPPGTGK
jgi:hypothetical protein